MSESRHSEAAFEAVIEAHLLQNGYIPMARDSLLDVLARFIHLQTEEKRDDHGRKVKAEAMIFPRYHQLDAVRLLVQKARCEGVGNNYLIEHSAGSGKSNTIGWLAHRLASLHDAANERTEICAAFSVKVPGPSLGRAEAMGAITTLTPAVLRPVP